jgi:GT2 family glycosyltransferase
LTRLRRNGSAPFETVLVDNASSDGSTAFVARTVSSVRIVEAGQPGFAGGNDAGARAARGTQLAFLNNARWPRPTGWRS